MQINIKDTLEVLVLLSAAAGMLYRLAKIEGRMESQITHAVYELKLHLTACNGDKEMTEYRLNGLDEKIDHKFERLQSNQKEIQQFLQKTSSFVPRDN